MSKTTKLGDLWQHVFAAAAVRPESWCKGCGYHHAAYGVHRADCTAINKPTHERNPAA